MVNQFTKPEEYISSLDDERKAIIEKFRKIIHKHLPTGFEECIQYNMLAWVVPYEIYPDGYHCKPKLPLPFLNLASQKNFIALYHMGIYANKELLDWFVAEYPKHAKYKLDMGKSCIRFKRMDDIPFELIGELMAKMNPQDWIKLYEKNLQKK